MKSTIPPNTPPMIGPIRFDENEVVDTEFDRDGMEAPLLELGWTITLEAPPEVERDEETDVEVV